MTLAKNETHTPGSIKLPPATEQPDGMPPGAVQFEIGLFGPHPVPLTLQCRPTSKQQLRDMLFAMVDQYYERCESSGLLMHAGAPVIQIAQQMPGKN